MAVIDRCPRCAYPLTGLPGAPEHPYGRFRTEVRCPECALFIPEGARCLTGGSSAGVVESGGLRSMGAIALAAAIAVGGPWACIMGSMFILGLTGRGIPRRGYSLGSMMNFAAFLTPLIFGALVAAWLLWRRWHRLEDSERAGARERRALVAHGAIYLWQGAPRADAAPKPFAAGDIREIRGRRHLPLFPRKGALQVAAIDFITPLTLWTDSGAKELFAKGMRARTGMRGSALTPFAATLWTELPPGASAEAFGRDVEQTLRIAPAAGPPASAEDHRASADDHQSPDPDRLAIPATITAGTPGEPPICPGCSALLAPCPATQGVWWEPLPEAIACPRCGLQVPAGALVICGFRRAGEGMFKGGAAPRVLGLIALFLLVLGAAVFTMVSISRIIGVMVQVMATVALSVGIPLVIRRFQQHLARPRARFQRGSLTWIVQPSGLRIVTRGRRTGHELLVPARGLSRLEFGVPFSANNQMSMEAETIVAHGTADALGLTGERFIHVPLPAEASEDAVEAAIRTALGRG